MWDVILCSGRVALMVVSCSTHGCHREFCSIQLLDHVMASNKHVLRKCLLIGQRFVPAYVVHAVAS